MYLTILLLSAAAIGLFISAKSNKTSIILITIGLIIGIILALFPVKELKIPGIYFYLASLLPVFYYGFTIKSKSIIPRMILLLMPASMFAFWLWTENHWHGNTTIALWFTLILAAIGLIFRKELRKEGGILLIITMDAFTLIIENLLKQFS